MIIVALTCITFLLSGDANSASWLSSNDDSVASELCGTIKKLAPKLGHDLLYNQILNHVSSCLKVHLISLVKDLPNDLLAFNAS